MFDLAESDLVQHKVRAWHQRFGDIFYTKIGGTDYVWLSNIYSSRPSLPLAQDVASAGRRQLFMAYGPQWRQLRKHSHALLNLKAAEKYQHIQDFESKQVMRDLLERPDMFYDINRRYSASVIMLLCYGYRISSFEDPLIKKIYTVLNNLTEITAPGAHAVDSFPSLAVLPQFLLGNWYTYAREVHNHDRKVYMELWEQLKKEVDEGKAADCFCRDFYLSDPAENGIDNLLAAYTCGGLVEAGSETTATTLNNWMLAMTCFPEALKKAQAEVDSVVGSERLPTFSDEPNLPYVRAMIKEVMRWRPVNKFGMFHATSEDDWYEGYFIPKGTTAPLPAANYVNCPDPYDRDHFTYGAGRRVCPGIHVAERSLFINIARVIWGFDIGKRRSATGEEIEPTTKMVPGFLSVPLPFECTIKPRSMRQAQKIRDEFAKAEKDGVR
ncbi:hypothetical protein KVR01_012637 [Diaporthe batatas]|uniref:uncharacterized protein n=1 Tax=Diaporthe batatas TaxID=748121 RepID=UPI001D0483E2|nr:uncharacterized protein KVR01_012637 [Diaporthe batatas]KAG8157595.1 hypothetical protein KVR01_012637 [Diaporthe batatas]